jgi:Glu-tRNA(Gln) amidotransferase subunit E-like FAD-binding protein
MEKIDYEKIGFKSGLEIHQQLDTHKLFCNCQSVLRKDDPNFEIKRRLHVVAGESGEVDLAARHEAEQDREFIYQGYDTTCLVELDECPPYEINQEALKIVLHISLLLNATILPVSQIMRKTVIDGSNTSGFQRTVMIARDGWIETSQGKVGVEGIFLEEDSARHVSTETGRAVFKLDRLGIPLIEIATAPDIKNAEHAKETALKIGDILRSCKVKRGIGTIRQDINLSIKGGNRVELKGFQDPSIMIDTIEIEIARQLSIFGSGVKNPSEVRNVLSDGSSEFLRPMPGSARMYPETDLPLLKIPRDMINEAKKTLPQLREEFEAELRRHGLSQEYIKTLFKQNKIELYKELYYLMPKPHLIAKMILVFPKDIATRKKIDLKKVEEKIEDHYGSVLELVLKKKISEGEIKNVLEDLIEGKSLEEAIKKEKTDFSEIEEKIHKIIKEKPGLSANAYMGLAMKELKGLVGGNDVMEIIKKYVK